ncbi:MAG: DUF4136 domain-containing protein [Bacteroidetes bacterium]|nr:DUF4136 domain-containing protein [Bacteroidota bacterium]
MSKTIFKNATSFILWIILISSCKTPYDTVYSNYDENIDFTKYKTYAWLNTIRSDTSKRYANDIIENNAKHYIDREFADRGYSVNLENPDILLELSLVNERKEETVVNPYNCDNYTYYNYPYNPLYNNNPYFYDPYYNNYNYYYEQRFHQPYVSEWDYSTCSIQKIEYIKGSITINVVDKKLNRLVWTGTAEGDIYDPDYLQSGIHPAIEKILNKYPIKSIRKEKDKDGIL